MGVNELLRNCARAVQFEFRSFASVSLLNNVGKAYSGVRCEAPARVPFEPSTAIRFRLHRSQGIHFARYARRSGAFDPSVAPSLPQRTPHPLRGAARSFQEIPFTALAPTFLGLLPAALRERSLILGCA